MGTWRSYSFFASLSCSQSRLNSPEEQCFKFVLSLAINSEGYFQSPEWKLCTPLARMDLSRVGDLLDPWD